MKSRTTWFLLVITLAVAAYVSWDVKKGKTTDEARQRRKRVVELKANTVTGLELVRTNQTIVLKKTGDRWSITKPYAVRASNAAVNSLLDELELAERQRLLTATDLAGMKLADFGLEPPRLKLTLQRPGGALTVLVGNETPTKDAQYVQVAGQAEILVVQKYIVSRLDRSLDDLRERTVVELTPSAATRLQIKNRERFVELVKTQNRWHLSQPLAARADSTQISSLLTTLSGLRVADFVSEEPAAVHAHDLDEPVTEVTVWTGETGQTLLIGATVTNDTTKVYAKLKSADSIFTVPADAAQKFVVQINDLRDRSVLPVETAEVASVQIWAANQELKLTRTDTVWRVMAPQEITAETSIVDEMLRKLTGLRVQEFIADVPTDLDSFGLAAPGLTVSLYGQGTNILAQLLIGSLDLSNGWRYVKRGDEPFVYGVESNLVGWVPTTVRAVRTRRLADWKADDIKKLAVTQDKEQVIIERNSAEQWQLVQPTERSLDSEAARRLAEAVAGLRAEEFLESAPVESGLETPTVTVTATVGNQEYVIRIGQPNGTDKRYAAWADPAAVFTVTEFTAQTLSASLLSPPATNTPPGNAAAP